MIGIGNGIGRRRGNLLRTLTNALMQQPSAFGSAPWVTTLSSVSTDADGTADGLILTAPSGDHYISQNVILTFGGSYAFSVDAKAGDRRYLVWKNDSLTASKSAIFDLQLGIKTAEVGCAASIFPTTGGYYRVFIDWTADLTNNNLSLYSTDNAFGGGTTGTGAIAFYLKNAALAGPQPTAVANRTLVLDAAQLVTAGAYAVWNDSSGNGRSVNQATASMWPAATMVGGYPAVDFDGSNDRLVNMSAFTITSILTSTAYAMFAVCYIDAINAADAAATHNDGIISSVNGVFGLCLKNTPILQAAHYDGGFKQDTRAVATGAITLLASRFKTGTVYASVDGVDGAGAASGTISSFTGGWEIGRAQQGPNYYDGKLLWFEVWNVAMSDGDWAARKTALKAQFGIP